jgi:hypothetical protein
VLNRLLPLLAVAALMHAAAEPDTDGASRAFARYLAGGEHAGAWSPETIDIEASLPKLQKQGRLRAIRRVDSRGKADYQVLESGGDRMVRQQVIERYLTAQMTAAEIPAASVAITPANYEFRYRGVGQFDGADAYVFQIKPRKKRTGLMSGELWLDAETGLPVRQTGRLVKSPSLFVKSVGILRETVLRGGVVQRLLTHLSVDTRLVGLADLTVTESPLR